MKKNKSVKLIGKKQIILLVLGLCVGLGLFIRHSYEQKGYISGIDVASIIFSTILGIVIFSVMAWWGNRPEKKD